MRTTRWNKALLAIGVIAVGATVLSGCSAPGGSSTDTTGNQGTASGTVIQYNSADGWANYKEVREAFFAESGITVPADPKNSGEALSLLQTQKDYPQADVAYWTINFGIQAADEDLLEPYKSATFDDVPEALKDPDGLWTAIHYGVIALIVNKDALNGADVPDSWDDLLKPEYKGLISYSDPSTTGVGYYAAHAINLAMGGDEEDMQPAIDYFNDLNANGAAVSGHLTAAKVASGEIPILIDTDFNGFQQKFNADSPHVEVVLPSDGTVKVPYTIAMVKGGPNPEAAETWIDFLLSPDGQQLFTKSYIHPVIGEMPADIQKNIPSLDVYSEATDLDPEKILAIQNSFNEQYVSDVAGG